MYNSFLAKEEESKSFHERLMENYSYEQQKQSRKVSQI